MGDRMWECSFLVPVRGDEALSEGGFHSSMEWEWLDDQLWRRFRAATQAPGLYAGFYPDADTGARVADESRRYIVAISEERFDELRSLMSECCIVFKQKCMYLNLVGEVEFIERPATP